MPFPLSLLTAGLALSLTACGPGAPAEAAIAAPRPAETRAASDTTRAASASSPYRFDQPVARFELPDALREISALTVLDEGHLGAVQDEEGDLYVLDIESGRVTAVVPFGPPGDYEGVELANGRLFVLRADGALLELEGWAAGREASPRTFDTGLGARACDAEGLGYDASTDRLLVSCKEEGSGALDGRNAVYGFHLATNTLDPEPVFALDPSAIPGNKKLRPSALAVHPITGHTVALSSKRESLVSVDAAGAVVGVWDLAAAAFEQPEGLVFLPNGDVFVSSEGGDGPAVLLRFAYEPGS